MIRITLADDHTIIRDGLKKIISTVPDMQVVGEAADGHELLSLLRLDLPDVLLLDMSMPGRSGILLIQQLRASHPALPILVLSMYRESQYAVQAIRAGAAGYLTKNVESDQLLGAIRKVARGGTVVSPTIADRLVMQARQPEAVLPHARLTARELQVFQMLAEGQGKRQDGEHPQGQYPGQDGDLLDSRDGALRHPSRAARRSGGRCGLVCAVRLSESLGPIQPILM